MWPLPVESLKQTLLAAPKTLLIEGNSLSQMGDLIREQTGIKIESHYLRYDGRPFYPDDVIEKIKELLK